MQTVNIPADIKEKYKLTIEKIREDRSKYFDWIKSEIEIAINLINQFDKKYVLGGLGVKLIQSLPTLYNQFLESYSGDDKKEISKDELIQEDDEIEVLLEYAMSIATANTNTSTDIPTIDDIETIYNQLSKIKSNINFWELSAENPVNGNEFDHWLRTNIMQESINVRGSGYHIHIKEIFAEIFIPFNGFLEQYYSFNATDVYNVIENLDSLVYSKIGNPFGATHSHKRLTKWMENIGQEKVIAEMIKTGKHFIRQFTEANPDLYDESNPEMVTSHFLDNISGYSKIFWVIPQTTEEILIFERLSHEFSGNINFFQPPNFKAFPLNDSIIKKRPLIKENGKFYHFSMNLAFRNVFKIVEELIKDADEIYYENYFKGNSNSQSRDNYLENKTIELFQRIVPAGTFYHSLNYEFNDNGKQKKTELDVLGMSGDTAYIIEVKAGELNEKHRRGALKGLKDRLKETISEGSYQCHRALNYILENETPTFEYVQDQSRKTLTIDKNTVKEFYKISVTLEHFSTISANLKYLIESGVISPDFKWTWIVSLYDLMIFADIIESENDFKEFLQYRIGLYDRNDIEFSDEIDILGFYLEGNFPLRAESSENTTFIVNYKKQIDDYYQKIGVGMIGITKPKKKTK